jgi:hypothetical protein
MKIVRLRRACRMSEERGADRDISKCRRDENFHCSAIDAGNDVLGTVAPASLAKP